MTRKSLYYIGMDIHKKNVNYCVKILMEPLSRKAPSHEHALILSNLPPGSNVPGRGFLKPHSSPGLSMTHSNRMLKN